MTRWLMLLYCLLVSVLTAGDKEEQILRDQLAAAAREKAALIAALAKAQAGTAKAADAATTNAASIQLTAESNAADARQAAIAAAAAAAATHVTAIEDRRAIDQGTNALMILQVSGFLTLLAGFLYKAYTDSRERRWALEDAQRKHEEQIASIKAGAKESTAAIEHSNNLTQKLVDMRGDIALALADKKDK